MTMMAAASNAAVILRTPERLTGKESKETDRSARPSI